MRITVLKNPDDPNEGATLMERDELDVAYCVQWTDNAHAVGVEFRRKSDGKLVRRDAHVSILRGLEVASESGRVG